MAVSFSESKVIVDGSVYPKLSEAPNTRRAVLRSRKSPGHECDAYNVG